MNHQDLYKLINDFVVKNVTISPMSNVTLSQHLARLMRAEPQPVTISINLIFMIKTFYDKKHVAITQFSYGRCIKLGYV